MPQHIVRLLILLAVFLASALGAKVYFTDDSFYRYGHYRGDAVAELATGDPRFRGPGYCEKCHVERHAQWNTGVHKGVKCEVCHTPADKHPATGKLPVPSDTVALCTLCHERMPGRPTAQPQIVVKDHPYPHEDRLECVTCHNPHSPTIGEQLPVEALAIQCVGCHGAQGEGVGAFPGLADKSAAYLIEEMRKYKSGLRQNPMMTPLMQGLSDRDIEELAKYYAAMGGKSAAAPAAPAAAVSAVALLTAKCVGCHGEKGQGAGTFPPLAGKEAGYLIEQLSNYKSGVRQNPMMTPIAKALSDDDIAKLAEHYAALGDGPVPAPASVAPSVDSATEQLTAKCVGCHGTQGQGVGTFPALAGKPAEYLVDQMNNYRSGVRDNPVMTSIAKGLTGEQIEKLATYYSLLAPKE